MLGTYSIFLASNIRSEQIFGNDKTFIGFKYFECIEIEFQPDFSNLSCFLFNHVCKVKCSVNPLLQFLVFIYMFQLYSHSIFNYASTISSSANKIAKITFFGMFTQLPTCRSYFPITVLSTMQVLRLLGYSSMIIVSVCYDCLVNYFKLGILMLTTNVLKVESFFSELFFQDQPSPYSDFK